MTKGFLLACFLINFFDVRGQFFTITDDFSWATPTSSTTSSGVFGGECNGGSISVNFTTDLAHQLNDNGTGVPIAGGHPIGSALVPWPTLAYPLDFRITLTFPTPVYNVALLIRDIDDDGYMPGPEEHLKDFLVNGSTSFPSSITAVSGSFSSAGGIVTPLVEGCRGWFQFSGTPISSVSFLYTRPIINYAILFDSIQFDCSSHPSAMWEPFASAFSCTWNPNEQSLLINNAGGYIPGGVIEVLDTQGSLVHREAISASVQELHLKGLSPGVYFIRYSCNNNNTTRKIFIP